MASDTGTELRRARSGRIPENVLVECTVSGLDDPGRSRCGRLTDLEMQHLTAGEFAFLRSSHDFHHEERGDLTAARRVRWDSMTGAWHVLVPNRSSSG